MSLSSLSSPAPAQSVAPVVSRPAVSLPVVSLPVVSLRELLPWVVFVALMAALLVYFVGAEQGATSVLSGSGVHEFLHDGRHLLGFPCH